MQNVLGVGNKLSFGSMIGCGVGSLSQLFPTVFRVVSNKDSSIKDCYVGEGGFVSSKVVRRVLHPFEETLLFIHGLLVCGPLKVRKVVCCSAISSGEL